MELREFLKIFIDYKKTFFGIITFFILCGIVYFFVQPETYKASLTLNISRGSASEVNEYAYDDFYRLQADERFGDTVVRWLQSPWVVKNILEDSNVIPIIQDSYDESHYPKSLSKDKQLRGFFNAERMSSQVVDVTFFVSNEDDAKVISDNLKVVINQEAEKLNDRQRQERWFVVLGDDPVVNSNEKGLLFLLALTGMMGLFVGFVVVMFWYYWNDEK